MRRVLWLFAIVLLVGGVWVVFFRPSPAPARGALKVERGSIVRRAVAVGRIEVEHEVPVKTTSGGLVTRLLVELGQRVRAGDPLAEVRPRVTRQLLLQSERSLKNARDAEEYADEFYGGRHLASWATRLFFGKRNLERMRRGAAEARRSAEEQLELLREGRATTERGELDYIVRAPVDGYVLDLRVREGAPVVPSSSYGSGTELMSLADLDRLVFRGTVDEIDVGRLVKGMAARIRIGALPEAEITGKLTEIALKARQLNNAVVFGVRIAIEAPASVILRSGFSAVADIEIDRRDDVLTLPERAVDFRDGSAFVQVPDGPRRSRELEIETGLSDGFTVEITAGLEEGAEVLERVGG